MLTDIRSQWRILKRGTPGRRFEEMYRRRHARRKGPGTVQRVLTLVLGGLLVVAGPIAGLLPGPGGILISVLGWALLASEVLMIARWLDRLEPKVRRVWNAIVQAWKRAATATRIAVCVVGTSFIVMLAVAIHAWVT